MGRNLKVTLVIVLLISTTSSQSCSSDKVEVICRDISNGDLTTIGNIRRCIGDKSIVSNFPDSSLKSVIHSNKSAVENMSDIKGLNIDGAKVKFIPTGITSKFPNLKALTIASSGLLSVGKENLREFGSSLEFLWLKSNSISFISADLFVFNINIRLIGLEGNPIRHIEAEFFANLKKLSNVADVEIGGSEACMSGRRFQTSSGHNITTFVWNSTNCSNETARIETQLSHVNGRIQHSLNNDFCLESRMSSMENRMSAMEEKLEKVIKSVERLTSVLKDLF